MDNKENLLEDKINNNDVRYKPDCRQAGIKCDTVILDTYNLTTKNLKL